MMMAAGRAAEKSRALIVEPSGLLWGSERALLDLLAHIDRSRFDVVVVCPAGAPITPHLDALAIAHASAPLQLLHQRGRMAKLRAAASLHRLIGRLAPDVIHVNQAGLGRLTHIAAAGRAPVLSHVRLFEDARAIRIGGERRRRSSGYIAISKAIYDEMAPSQWRGESRVRIVYDPFDSERFRSTLSVDDKTRIRQELGIADAVQLVTLVGRLCVEKGQRLLVDAVGQLPTRNVVGLLVGDEAPGSGYRREIEEHIRQSALGNRVILAGERGDIADIMQASDVVVLASNAEPFGRVLLEALSVGTPVIATQVGGAREIIGDNERGLGFPAGDASALAQRILETLDDTDAALARTQRGAEHVELLCSPARHAREIERCYTNLIAQTSIG
jgi:L-malate glycosyltransferase